jgi:hypothetical protein
MGYNIKIDLKEISWGVNWIDWGVDWIDWGVKWIDWGVDWIDWGVDWIDLLQDRNRCMADVCTVINC